MNPEQVDKLMEKVRWVENPSPRWKGSVFTDRAIEEVSNFNLLHPLLGSLNYSIYY